MSCWLLFQTFFFFQIKNIYLNCFSTNCSYIICDIQLGVHLSGSVQRWSSFQTAVLRDRQNILCKRWTSFPVLHAIPTVPKSVKCSRNHDGKIDCFHFVSLFQAQTYQGFFHTILFSSGLTGAVIASKHWWRNGNSMHYDLKRIKEVSRNEVAKN